MKCIIADSGPLIVLGDYELLDVVQQVAGDVIVPATVFDECTRHPGKPGAVALLAAAAKGLIAVQPDPDSTALGEVPTLDAGEIAALALALQLKAPVLMDERLGRQIAALHHIPVIGSAGILLAAKQRGLIPSVAPILKEWQLMGYFLSPSLLEAVLKKAGEEDDS